ncbi:MAG: primosomal protein N' [Desulfobulbus propionicus]|nr:MAG: primosomal protein N' [Desulfobulbus propionicus]
MMKTYEVAVDAPVEKCLTYSQPPSSDAPLPVGSCVLVPLAGRKVTGYVVTASDSESTAPAPYPVKPVTEVLSATPVFPAGMLELYHWIATYYHYPLGGVIKTGLSMAPSARSGNRITLTAKGEQYFADSRDPEVRQYQQEEWARKLVLDKTLPPGTTARYMRSRDTKKAIGQLVRQGYITCASEVVTKKVPVKRQVVYRLDQECIGQDKTLAIRQRLKPSEQKTVDIFMELVRGELHRSLPRSCILHEYKNASPALRSLCEKNIFIKKQQRVYRNPFGETPPSRVIPVTLSEEQQDVLAHILPAVDAGRFSPFLLFGITGCGKTEVYLRAVSQALCQGKSALVLVPEIALASQMEQQFYARFGESLALYHSGLPPGERHDQWQRIIDGRAQVVLGARSGVFAPLENLGIIIVDEEHEPAYKQEDALRYHGRDVAVMRAKFASCPIILGSATPSVTSYHNSKTGKYTLLTMTKRVEDRPMPGVRVIDLGKSRRRRPDLFFSDELISAIQATLERRQQTLLFINRRGYSSSLLCQDCGQVLQCRHCQVSLTLHRSRKQLLCHYCGFAREAGAVCHACQSRRLIGVGLGAERIENEAGQLFPEARIARLDSDVASDRKHYMKILKAVRDQEIDILVGTQMIAKGLHFPGITLVGILWADAGLAMPDYKAGERTFSLLSQVTGRAGRGKEKGEVIIQTHQPGHPAIRFARKHDYVSMYELEQRQRAQLLFPPHARMVNIRFSGSDEAQVQEAAEKTRLSLEELTSGRLVDILGPAPAPLGRIKDKYRWQLLLKSRSQQLLHEACSVVLQKRQKLTRGRVVLVVDRDPENMM